MSLRQKGPLGDELALEPRKRQQGVQRQALMLSRISSPFIDILLVDRIAVELCIGESVQPRPDYNRVGYSIKFEGCVAREAVRENRLIPAVSAS